MLYDSDYFENILQLVCFDFIYTGEDNMIKYVLYLHIGKNFVNTTLTTLMKKGSFII